MSHVATLGPRATSYAEARSSQAAHTNHGACPQCEPVKYASESFAAAGLGAKHRKPGPAVTK